MIGADKWHRGYVQGMARDGGEVQGMTGVERGFSMGQWILKSVVSVASVYLSVYPFICHNSVYLSLLIMSLFLVDTGLYKSFSILLFCLLTKLFHFGSLFPSWYMYFLYIDNCA